MQNYPIIKLDIFPKFPNYFVTSMIAGGAICSQDLIVKRE